MSDPVATVLIVTRNRRDRVADAVRAAKGQNVPVEVLVVDDASTDGTAEHLRHVFPGLQIERLDTAVGCPRARNRGFELASTELVVCLDDDLVLPSDRVIAETVAAFDDAHIAVVTIPYTNVHRENFERQRAPQVTGAWIAGTFAGGASALRRSAFLAVGGYPVFRGHGEETDLALRLLDSGSVVRLGTTDGAVHDEEVVRKSRGALAGSSRNHLVTAWRTTPLPFLPSRLVVVAVKVLIIGVRRRRPLVAACGVGSALRAILTGAERRTPVAMSTYRTARRLMRRGPQPIESVMEQLHR